MRCGGGGRRRRRAPGWSATDPDGTATLTGRSLPPAEVLAADKRLCQVARYWKKRIRAAWKQADPGGQLPRPEHGLDLLRAKAYLALLLGQPLETPPADLLPPSPAGPRPAQPRRRHQPRQRHLQPRRRPRRRARRPGGEPGSDELPAGLRRPDPVAGLPPMAGLISLTIPLSTFLGVSDRPGEAAGYGPLHAGTARLIACALAGHRATRWQVILTNPDGRALAAGTARGNPATPGGTGGGGAGSSGGGGWTVQVTAEPIAVGHCDHRNQEPGHDPSPGLQRLVRARSGTCTSPGCRRPATSCDLDHVCHERRRQLEVASS